ncbi:FxSxx-COOH system tetratricopeptide repeat protein [Streptomyces sp. Caat 7-52]|uniref:FxSxx-COOH system tetratricopeptide repeat protein n=1 Tax=Streptomyces sp. Caat 7-52 TaxID=2949637 RepID=UPI002035A9CE|nr:FxSxx-COOH system tetratricopeptide repeat protein [Streptomyces sp. Caat 7-52]
MTGGPTSSPPTAREWAEALWLAARMAAGREDRPDDAGAEDREAAARALPEDPRSGADEASSGGTLASRDARTPRRPGHTAGASGPPDAVTPAASALFDSEMRPGVLRDPLRLARTLRPFNRRVRSRHHHALDEETTAVRSAELGRWSPVLTDLPGRWFDVALVVEQSPSMAVWWGVAGELVELLRRQGAFADVRIWQLDTRDGKAATLRPERGGPARAPGELFHPQGRRLILLMSDCVGDAWAGGTVPGMMHRWARHAPVAVLQPLPGRLWDLCEAVPRDVQVRTTAAGQPNALLPVRRDRRWVRGGPSVVPVLELESAWFAGWARLVTAAAGTPVDVAALLVQRQGLAPECLPPLPARERHAPVSAEQTVLRFLRHASPQARRLAALLAMVPLRPEVVKAVQRLNGWEAGPLPFAEILLGGLLSADPGDGGDGPVYTFLDGVRERLLRGLGRTEVLRMLQEVSEVAARVIGARPDLLGAVLVAPAVVRAGDLGTADRELLAAAAPVLAALGPPYASVLEGTGARASPAAGGRRPGASAGGGTPGHARPAADPGRPTRTPRSGAASPEPLPGPARGPLAPAESGPSALPRESAGLPRTMPLPQASEFTGRRAELAELARLFGSGRGDGDLPYAVLYGTGGVGKTRLAVEYVLRHRTGYQRIWWVDAQQPTVIREQLASLSPEFGDAAEGPGDPVDRVLTAMATGKPFTRWLLVMDNAGPADDVLPYVPSMSGVPEGAGHVLVTSRHSSWTDHVAAVPVAAFDRETSIEFLRRHLPWASPEQAERLAGTLGDLPLALEHSVAAQTESAIGTDVYLDLLERQLDGMLAEAVAPEVWPVTAAWRTSVDLLRERSPQARELLRLLALFGPGPVALSFLHSARSLPVPDALAPVTHDEAALTEAVRAMSRFSLLTVNPATETLQVPRPLARVLLDEMPDAERTELRHLAHRILAGHDPGDSQRPQHWRNYADILPHLEPTGLPHCEDEAVRATVLQVLGYVIAHGDFPGAVQLGRRIAGLWTEALGPDHVQTLWARRQQASAHWQLSEFEECRRINGDVLRRLRATVGDDHKYTLTVAGATAADLRAAGRFTEALTLDQDVYERSVRLYGAADPYVLTVGHNYAVCLRVNGLYTEALALDERVHEGRLAVLGPRARSTLFSINNVARDLRECGRYGEALELQTDTLERCREQYGDQHPHTLRAIRNMAVICRKAGRPDRGLALAHEALELSRGYFGREHLDTLETLMNLANGLRPAGEAQAACAHSAEALDGYRAVLGRGHPLTGVAGVNHGAALRAAGRYDEARGMDQEAVATLAGALPEDHPWLLLARVDLATDLSLGGDPAAGRALGEECARRLVVRYGDRHPMSLAALTNVALDTTATGATEAGAELLERVRRGYLATLGPGHPESRGAAAGIRVECDIDPAPI